MPLPLPDENEEQKDFISRCMGDDFMVAEFEDNAQRVAVCHSQWDKKEAKEAKMVTKLSAKDKQTMLQNSLRQEYKIGQTPVIPKDLIVEEVYDDHVVYSVDGQLFKADYKLDEKGAPSYSDPVKVTSTKVFKTMEALQTTYSELIQEAGKRNALKDAGRVKEILRLCQELLSSEVEPEEKTTKEALKEANSVLKLVKAQAAMKLEDGESFPVSAFAYASDLDDPDNWKLRLWESLETGITRRQLNKAAASLSIGGHNGHKANIPDKYLSEVKRIIRTGYRGLGVDMEEIPKWVREVETRELALIYTPLTEAR